MRNRQRNRRILYVTVAAIIVAFVVVFGFIIESSVSDPGAALIGQPIPSSLYQQISGVNNTVLSVVGNGRGVTPALTAPSAISGTTLLSNGKPEILYVGGEFCPFCAVERWSLVIALSRFGNFTGIEYMQSSATDTNPDTPTFTFANATYTSKYIAFVPVEEYDRSDAVRQPLTTAQQSLETSYDSSGSIPFIDFANQYVISGAQSSLVISGQSWTTVASQLNNPNTTVAKNFDGAANLIITAICRVDGGQPGSVCGQSYATLTLAYEGAAQQQQSDLQASLEATPLIVEKVPWTI